MIRTIFEQVVAVFAETAPQADDAAAREHALHTAAAVLMIDVATADHVFADSELKRVLSLVEQHFGFTPQEAATLVDAAGQKAADLTSLYEFTQLLNQHLDETEKARIVGLLWEVAYADGELDKYEDSLVLKISDLLYVSRGLVMRLKHDAAQSAG